MAKPTIVYGAIRLFLLSRGYCATQCKEGVNDGHMILHWIDEFSKSECYTNEKGVCVLPSFEKLFTLLENGSYWKGDPLIPGASEWTRAYTNAALQAGGFQPKVD